MCNTEIYFSQPKLLYLAIPLGILILLPYLLAKRKKGFKRIAPVIIHEVLMLLLVALLSGLSFLRVYDQQSVYLLLDCSDSTAEVRAEMLASAKQLSAEALAAEGCSVEAFAFGAEGLYKVDLSADTLTPDTELNATATNLEQALREAAERMPKNANRRIVLLTDGNQTDGDLLTTVLELAKEGYRVDAVPFGSGYLHHTEIQLSALET